MLMPIPPTAIETTAVESIVLEGETVVLGEDEIILTTNLESLTRRLITLTVA